MENKSDNIGEFIKKLRKEKNYTIAKLSEKSSVSSTFISQVENGQRNPSADILGKLAGPLGVPKNYLLYIAGYIDPVDMDTLSYHIASNYQFLASIEEQISYHQSQLEGYPPSHPFREVDEDQIKSLQQKRIKYSKELDELLSEQNKLLLLQEEKAINADNNNKQRIYLDNNNEGNLIFFKNNEELPANIQEKLRSLIKLTLE